MRKRKKWFIKISWSRAGDEPIFQSQDYYALFKDSDSLAYIPTPMGMQEFIIQTSCYEVDGQKIELDYQLQNQEGQAFASYQLEITWG